METMGTRYIEKLLTLVFDVIAVMFAFVATFWIRYQSNFFPEVFNPELVLADYLIPGVILSTCWLILFFFTGLYRDWYKESRLDELLVVCRTVALGLVVLFLITGAPQFIEFARTGDPLVFFTRTKFATLFTYGGFMMALAPLNRFATHTLFAWLFAKGLGIGKVLIVGANESGHLLSQQIRHYPHLGYEVAGFIDDDGRKHGTAIDDLPVFGTYADIPSVVKHEKIQGLIISQVSSSANEILKIVTYCEELNIMVYMVPSLMDVMSGHLKTHQIFGVPLVALLKDHMPRWEAQIKRIMDIAVSLSVLVLGAPLWLFMAFLVRATSKGPAVYCQERVGQNGKPFVMMKFRSMFTDAETLSGPKWATENDPRITPLGRFLRKTRFDEIPQFINVLKGEMSLVGPRPERAFFIEQLKKEIPWYVRRIKMKPGITGWAQVKHKYDASIEDVKQKVLYDLYYFENMSIVLDLKIMLRTLMVVVTGKGAH